MKVLPFKDYTFGCEITELGSFENPSDSEKATILDAFTKYRLIVVKGGVETQKQMNLVSCISPLSREGDSQEFFTYVSTKPDELVVGEDPLSFHHDYTWTPYGPIQVLSLYAEEMDRSVPTIFADCVVAVDQLPIELREKLRQMNLQVVAAFAEGSDGYHRQRMSYKDRYPAGSHNEAVHPAIDRHPLTGKDVLRLDQALTSNFVGMSEDDSDVLFEEIGTYQYGSRNVYTHNWEVGDLVLWDNNACQHARPPIEGGVRRTLRRIIGNPVPATEIAKHLKPDTGSRYYKYEVDRANA